MASAKASESSSSDDSSYVPTDSEEEESEDEDVDMTISEEEEEEGSPNDDDDDIDSLDGEGEMQSSIDLKQIKFILETHKSKKMSEIMEFCLHENQVISEIHKTILAHLDEIAKDRKTPKGLTSLTKDAWIHIIEVLSDHIEDIITKVKHC